MISFILPGRVLVIDPIIALMNDQEDNLRLNGIDRVVAINSETYKTTEDMKIIMNSVEQGDNLIMLVAPERLLIPEFNQSLKSLFDGNIPLSLIVFDEIVCPSVASVWIYYIHIMATNNLCIRFENQIVEDTSFMEERIITLLKDIL